MVREVKVARRIVLGDGDSGQLAKAHLLIAWGWGMGGGGGGLDSRAWAREFTTVLATYLEEVVIRSCSGRIERQVEEFRHDQTDDAEHGNTPVLDLRLLVWVKIELNKERWKAKSKL